MNILEAFEILTRFFMEHKGELNENQITAWNVIRMNYTDLMGTMMRILGEAHED